MSNASFPVLPGLAWDNTRIPNFNTRIHKAFSGREARAALQAFPMWTFSLSYEVLRDTTLNDELETLAGFFLQRQGSFDSFLYTDPTDNSVTDQSFGIGDAVTTQFQLVRTWATWVEPVMAINVVTNIKVNGVVKTETTDYTIDSNGMVTFVAAPAASATITWTGSYFYRCRFDQDIAEFNQMMKDLWELQTITFIGSVGNKV